MVLVLDKTITSLKITSISIDTIVTSSIMALTIIGNTFVSIIKLYISTFKKKIHYCNDCIGAACPTIT